MADLNELFKKASDKKSVPISPTKRSFGLKETMASIKSDTTIKKTDNTGEQTLGSRETAVRQTLGAQSPDLSNDKSDQPLSKAGSVKPHETDKAVEIKSEEASVETLNSKAKESIAPVEVKISAPLSVNEAQEEKNQTLGSREADVRQTLGETTLAKPTSVTKQTSIEPIQEPLVVVPMAPAPASLSGNGSVKPKHEERIPNLDGINSQSQNISIAVKEPISISPTIVDSIQTLGSREADVSQTLARREVAVSHPLGELNSDVRQTLGKRNPAEQPLGKPLARRELAVSQPLGETLDSREAAVRLIEQFKTLVGNERELTEIVFFEAKKTGTHTTDAIKSDKLCSYFNMYSTTLRNLVDRVKKKNILTCTSTVGGHSSVRIFTLSPVVYHHLMQQTLGGREVAVRWALGEPLGSRESDVSQTLGLAPRKEGSINNKYLTNLGEENITEPIELAETMFNSHQLDYEHTKTFMEDFNYWPKYFSDLKRNLTSKGKTISTDDLQNLLDRLPEYLQFSLTSGQPIKRAGPFFIKEAMNFAETGDCTLSLFKTKAEIQKDELIKQLRQKALDEKKKLSEEMDLIKQGAFKEWVESMSEVEQKNLAAPMNNSKMLIMSALRAKFESGIWEAKQRELGLI